MNGGNLGEFFSALAFASAGVSMLAFLIAGRKGQESPQSWGRLGIQAFVIHILSVVGIIGTLFGMIYFHQYQYHYVWAHSSDELPVYYMISCFWEGQEGSFLLWSFWHSILAIFILRKDTPWRNPVMAVISSVELILTSMILGVYLDESWVTGLFVLFGLVPMAWMAYRYLTQRNELIQQGQFHLLTLVVGLLYFYLLFSDHNAYQELFAWKDMFSSGITGIAFGFCTLFLVASLVAFASFLGQSGKAEKYPLGDVFAGMSLIILAILATFVEPTLWKIGSTPFNLLKDTFPNDPIYITQPGFVPTNGTGLNALLQNYWMVIHPPTLFLGFASTVIPFAYVIAGLIRGKYDEWMRPAMPWVTFSVMILGVGIIMGGYWAYETLNFGGYWNWDPVENSSFVPWLCGVASLHALLIYRKTKAYLRLGMILIISTFLLVLVSTFLTRSGILGETSVHTFTDLGLSGQLLILLLFYTLIVVIGMALRWSSIPVREDESKVWSAEFMLFLGILVFIFSGVIILVATSLPVINEIFGTDLAPPSNVQLFYYNWTIWFAIAFGALSGIGQFLWWRVAKNKSVKDALFRPFLLAMLSGTGILLAIWYTGMEFAYEDHFQGLITDEQLPNGFLGKLSNYLTFGVMGIADELLLFSSLFAVLANGDVLISLLRKNRKGLKVMGGTVVHIGFGLMLIGMLFSSGYDQVISTNPFPEELSLFPDEEKRDNVALPRFQTRPILGYNVTYLGRRRAEAPVKNLRILHAEQGAFKLAFEDVTGETYAMILPIRAFMKENFIQPTSDTEKTAQDEADALIEQIDFTRLERSLNKNLAYFSTQINGRTDYGIRFSSSRNPDDTFERYTESELQGEEGILPHPARKVYWNRDVYFYTSSLPNPDSLQPQHKTYELQVGDTVKLPVANVILKGIRPIANPEEELRGYDLVAEAEIEVLGGDGNQYTASPMYLIKGRQPDGRRDIIEELDMEFGFFNIDPARNIITLWISYIEPEDDLVVIKAISKPFINLLWLGTFILTFGFLLSIFRRIQENRKLG